MGRPIKRKYFGTGNVNDGQVYNNAGGEGISSLTYTNRGTNYSQGLTATVASGTIGGAAAVLTPVISTANGRVNSVTITSVGEGYLTAPSITWNKPANVAVLGTNDNFWQDGSNLRLSSTAGIYAGMFSNVAGKPSVKITNIYADGNIRGSATFGNVSSNTAISFGDLGSSVDIATVLAPTTTSANTIQANAWITGGTIGKVADIVAQRSSRRYKLNNADGFDSCRLVPQPGGVPTVATVTAAGGPTAVGEMTIQATDSAGGTYWVSKIESRTATVHPGGTGTPGTQFAANSQPIWTSTSAPTVNVSVRIGTND